VTRIGILGGTLDPIHCGHMAAAVAARDAFDLAEVLVLPSRIPPHRPVQPVASAFHRFAMSALAVSGVPRLVASDEATCQAWATRQGFPLDVLDRDFPAFSDACRWIWARMSRGLISDDEVTAKLARLRSRIMGASRAFDHSG